VGRVREGQGAAESRPRAYASEFEKRHEERFKGVAFDWKDFQRDGAPFPAPNLHARPAAQLIVRPFDSAQGRPATGGADKVLLDTDLRPAHIVWHPNGQLLAFTADVAWREELKYGNATVWTVTTDGKAARVTDDDYVYGDVDFSPDGRFISYARSFGTEMIIRQKLTHGGSRDLFIRPVGGGAPINLTANWDLEPGDARWSPDARFIYFTAEIGGEQHLFRTSVPAGAVEQVTKGPRRLGGLTIDRAFKTIAYTVGTHAAPPDVFAANIDGTGERWLSDVHAGITSIVAFSKADRLKWPSVDGTEIEGWLMYPAGYDAGQGPYPLIVTSHGGPHATTGYIFDFKKQYFAANGYFVFDTNFRSSTGYGDAFKWGDTDVLPTVGRWGR
jgi:dipeptidyl aminopeptidase/acylaminoacyl peptidase